MALSPTDRSLSHYRIVEQLGEGGMGVVYKAEDTRLKRTVALKFLPPRSTTDLHAKERFMREAQAASSLQHNNICTIHDIDESDDGQMYIVMDCYDGETLEQKLQRQPLGITEISDIARQIAQGMIAAHGRGIIHRDLKPSNIFVTREGVVKIFDFGLAKLQGGPDLTREGRTAGTVLYMSPEQVRGEEIDHRSDIWSFGVLLYRMLTSRLPFEGEYEQSIVYRILNEAPAAITSLRNGVPKELRTTVERCLEKDRTLRAGSMSEVLSLLQGEPQAASSTPRKAIPVALKRPSLWKTVAVVVAGILILVFAATRYPPFRTWVAQLFAGDRFSQKLLVVLPFTPIDSSEESRSFCAGLSWMVPSRLAELLGSDSPVSLLGSRQALRRGVVDPREARKMLGASFVITGAMQRSGEIVRLTVDLYDAVNDRQLDSRNGTYILGRYASIENDVVGHVMALLNLPSRVLSDDAARRGTADDEAYRFFAEGKGYLQLARGRTTIQPAIDLFRSALNRDSMFAQAHAALGECYWIMYAKTNDTAWIARAEREAVRATQIAPALPDAEITLGMIAKGTGKDEAAVKHFENAIALDAKSSEAYRLLADSYNNLGRYAEAELTLRLSIPLDPKYWMGYAALGYFYYTRGRYDEAATQFRKVVELAPENVDGYNNLGAMYVVAQHWDEAAAALEQAVQLDPTNHGLANLGAVYFYRKQYSQAARTYERALTFDSTDYRIWGSLAGTQYWAPGERERSLDTYRHAVRLAETRRGVNPKDPEVLSHLATFLAFLGERQRAIPLIEQSLKGARNKPEFLERAAESYNVLGEHARAAECLKKALEAGTDPGLVRLNPALAEVLADPGIRALLESPTTQPH